MNNNYKEALRWLNQAEYDLKSAEHSEGGEFYSTSCFQAQQAAEKAMKAFLILNGRRGVLGHSILTILKEASDYDSCFKNFMSHGRILDRYYIPTRYPDALPDGMPYEAYEKEDAQLAIQKSREIIDEVISKINTHKE